MSNSVLKVGVAGSFGYGNLGDEAVCPALEDLASDCGLSCMFIPISRFSDVPMPDVIGRSGLASARGQQLNGCPILFAGGGVVEPRHRCVLLSLEQEIQRLKPSSIYSFSMSAESGVKFSYLWKRRIRKAMRSHAQVWVRDVLSKDVLDRIGVKGANVSGDVILGLKPDNSASCEYEPGYIAVNLCPRWESDELWVQTVAQELCNISTEQDKQIVFVPMSSEYDSDVSTHQKVVDAMPDHHVARRSHILQHTLSPRQTLGVFAAASSGICMRLHAVVMCISGVTPCVSITYHPKIMGFLRTVGLQDACVWGGKMPAGSQVSSGYPEAPTSDMAGLIAHRLSVVQGLGFEGVESMKAQLLSSYQCMMKLVLDRHCQHAGHGAAQRIAVSPRECN